MPVFLIAAVLRAAAPAPATPPPTPTSPPTPAMRVVTDVTYLAPGRAEKLDLYLPEGRAAGTKSPAFVWIHGGSWIGGDKGEARAKEICGTLAGAGYVAVSINYKLGAVWPQALLDCKNAVRFLRAHAAEHGIDSDRIAVGGGSAGGHLALMVGFTAGFKPLEPEAPYPSVSSTVRAVIDCYGPANLVIPSASGRTDSFPGMRKVLTDSRAVWNGARPLFGGSSIALENESLEQSDARMVLTSASPTHNVAKGAPPVLIFHGLADAIVEPAQSIELAKMLAEHGVEHELVTLEGVGHSFDFEIANSSAGTPKLPRDLRPVALTFLAKHLATKEK